jgi:quinolinate synthase
MLLREGACIVQETFSEYRIKELQLQNPDAKLIAHPECEESLLSKADFIGSTSKLLNFISEDDSQSFIKAAEAGIIHQMIKAQPKKTFIAAPPEEENCSCNECPYMKLNTIGKLYLCMKNKSPEIVIDPVIAEKELIPINRMLQMG